MGAIPLFTVHGPHITGRNCICTISCHVHTSILLKVIYMISICHRCPLFHRGSLHTVVSMSSLTTVLYFLLHKGFKLYDNPCGTFHHSHCHLRCVSVVGNLWKWQEIRIASSQAVHTISFQDLNIICKAC